MSSSKIGSNQLSYQIRSFPKLNTGGHRYPVSYREGPTLQIITLPIGCLDCSPDCYTHSKQPKLKEAIAQKICLICRKSVNSKNRFFIDMGLMMLISKQQKNIRKCQYGWVNIDQDGRIIGWQKSSEINPPIQRLAKYTTKKIMEQNKGKFQKINYLGMKSVIRQKFSNLYKELKTKNNNKTLTWCRGNLRVDENFDGIIVNNSATPDIFNYYRFVDELGSGMSFDGKHIHMVFIPEENIFIILHSNSIRKSIDVYVADLTQGLIDNNKLRITQANNLPLDYKSWFSTCYDYKKKVLYIIGGEGASKDVKGKIQSFTDIKWDGKTLRYNHNEKLLQFVVARSLLAATMHRCKGLDKLFTAGGVVIKDRTVRYQLLNNIMSYKLQNNKMSEKIQAGNYKDKIGAYSNIVQIPKIVQGGHGEAMLMFAGNSDFRTDIDRNKFVTVYKWVYGDGATELKTKCSNTNFPFLFESTGVLVKTTDNNFVIRALIPARNSANRNVKAYLFQYDIKSNTLKQTALNSGQIK